MNRECRTCKFWHPVDEDAREYTGDPMEAPKESCRESSPQLVPHVAKLMESGHGFYKIESFYVWPKTHSWDWCHRWEPLIEDLAEEGSHKCENCGGRFRKVRKVLLTNGYDMWCCLACGNDLEKDGEGKLI